MKNKKNIISFSLTTLLLILGVAAEAGMWRPAMAGSQAPAFQAPGVTPQYSASARNMQNSNRQHRGMGNNFMPNRMPAYPVYGAAAYVPQANNRYRQWPMMPMQPVMNLPGSMVLPMPQARQYHRPLSPMPLFAQQYGWRPAPTQWAPVRMPQRRLEPDAKWVNQRDQGHFRPLMTMRGNPANAARPAPAYAPYVVHPQQNMRSFQRYPMAVNQPYLPYPAPWQYQQAPVGYAPWTNRMRPPTQQRNLAWMGTPGIAAWQQAYPQQPSRQYYANPGWRQNMPARMSPEQFSPPKDLAEDNWWLPEQDKSRWQACTWCGEFNQYPRVAEYDYSYR